MTLENRTKFVGNWAQFEGFSIYISSGWLRYLLPAPLGHWVGAATRWIPKDDDEITDGYNREIPDQLLWRWQRDLEELNGTDCTYCYVGEKEYDGRLVQPVAADGSRAKAFYVSLIMNS